MSHYLKVYLTVLFALISILQVSSQNTYTIDGKLGLGVVPSKQLEVDGDSKISGSFEVVDSTFLKGETEILGHLILKTPEILSLNSPSMLMVGTNGVVSSANSQARDMIYKLPCDELQSDPVWVNGTNKIYTGYPCWEEVKVGIGTALPRSTMEIKGDLLTREKISIGYVNSDALESLLYSDESAKLSVFLQGNQVEALGVYCSTQANKVFSVDNAGRLTLNAPDVGYESISIQAGGEEKLRLDSGGHIFAQKINVQLAPFPDYVFDDDYELMSIPDLELFIQKNKHLPNVPAAKEIHEKGADLGELTRVLIEKQEEMTLYIIQLEKRIAELEKTQK